MLARFRGRKQNPSFQIAVLDAPSPYLHPRGLQHFHRVHEEDCHLRTLCTQSGNCNEQPFDDAAAVARFENPDDPHVERLGLDSGVWKEEHQSDNLQLRVHMIHRAIIQDQEDLPLLLDQGSRFKVFNG